MVSINPLNWFKGKVVSSTNLTNPFAYSDNSSFPSLKNSFFNGDKFFDGFGATNVQITDYWTLRARSEQLFNENIYARGLIRRLVTNVVHTGLSPAPCPLGNILGLGEEYINEWSELVSQRFALWANNPLLCDNREINTFSELQIAAYQEALVSGDVLVIVRQSPVTHLPKIDLISGGMIRTPFGSKINLRKGNRIIHGVEIDSRGRHVAYWVDNEEIGSKRIPAYGEKSGRRIAWLLYGGDKRLHQVRGQPILSLALQSLKEIDRYRDSAQRKAVVNSIIAMFVTKSEDRPSSMGVGLASNQSSTALVQDGSCNSRAFNISSYSPGHCVEVLEQGENIVFSGGDGTDINFGEFEKTILQPIGWCYETPPEILLMSFSSNYSASQAAIQEHKTFLKKMWRLLSYGFCNHIYNEFLISESLLGKIDMPGFKGSWKGCKNYDIFGAWTQVDWNGTVKPSTDMLKQVKASVSLIEAGLSTHQIEAMNLNGTNYIKNMQTLKRENYLKAEALRPLAEFKEEFGVNEEVNIQD